MQHDQLAIALDNAADQLLRLVRDDARERGPTD
jgi:hypothetical protein